MSEKPQAEPPSLECPCCGDVGAIADEHGYFFDGQSLECGCSGYVSVGEDDVYISISDEECPPEARCHDVAEVQRTEPKSEAP